MASHPQRTRPLHLQRRSLGVLAALLGEFAFGAPAPLKTHEPVYQNPFDLAAGGAVLTRATQEGVIFSNPSLGAFGAGILRTITGRATLHLGTDVGDLIRKVAQDRSVPSDMLTVPGILDRARRTPVHAGQDVSAGALTTYAGVAGFLTTRVDLETTIDSTIPELPLPSLHMRNHAYSGAIASGSYAFWDKLALGVAAKYVYAGELDQSFGPTDFVDPSGLQAKALSLLKKGGGPGYDAGITLQHRTRAFDVRVAAVVNDFGGTELGSLPAWKQTISLGVGAALHNRDNAIHCGYDLRDVGGAYGEAPALRTYLGCKAIVARWVAVGAGMSQGKPTYGAVVNLLFLRLEAGRYTKRFEAYSGTKSRSAYFFSIGGEVP